MTNESDMNEKALAPVAIDGSSFGLVKMPLRVFMKTAAVAGEVGKIVATQSLETAKVVYDGARHGESPQKLATTIMAGWMGTVTSVMTEAAQVPVPHQVSEAAKQVVEFIPGGRLPVVGEVVHRDSKKDLRTEGKELLRRSAALEDPNEHPAFKRMLREMAPDEARIVCFLAESGPQPTINVIETNGMSRTSRELSRHVSLVGSEAGCIRPDLTPIYLDNLDRLGLVHHRPFRVGGNEEYELLEAQPGVDGLPEPSGRWVKHKIEHHSIELSQFGQQLHAMCFADQSLDT